MLMREGVLDATEIPRLTQDTLKAVRDVFVGVMSIFEQRGVRGPVLQVSDLFFWPGDMRGTLQRIADGHGTSEDIEKLKWQLEKSEPGVSAIVDTLNEGWTELIRRPDGLAIAREIGNVIHSPVGKMGIRRRIDEVTRGKPRDEATIYDARRLCDDIDRFNEQLIALHGRVLKPAAEIFAAR